MVRKQRLNTVQGWNWFFFIFWLSFSPSFQYLGDHEYTIFDPKSDTAESWQYWDLICKVLFLAKFLLKKGKWLSFPPQTSAPAGKRGKLVTLGSRKELDCLLQFINDQFDEPAFEVTIISQGRVPKYMEKIKAFFIGRQTPSPSQGT